MKVIYLRDEIRKKIKIGRAVEKVAQPIAGAIDKMAGTNLRKCEGCKMRKEWLNGLTA
jgi:hypothetical protein